MNFEACLETIEAMSGQLVEVRVSGPGPRSHGVASVTGLLTRMPEVELPPGIPDDAIAERAFVFVIGGGSAYLELWPNRFTGARMWKHPPDWLEVRTRDGRIVIGRKRPAWSD